MTLLCLWKRIEIMFHLMIKICNVTGLRYLCQTRKSDPIKYMGSGKLWKNHIKQYNYNYRTDVIFSTNDWEELKKAGRYYSRYFNIVNAVDDYGNKIWANLIPETGGGSGYHNKGKKRTLEQRKRIKDSISVKRGIEHPGFDAKKYEWFNIETKKTLIATRQEFISLTKCSPGNIVAHLKGHRKYVNKWVNMSVKEYRGVKSPGRKGELHSKYDHNIYIWKNINSHNIEKLTRYEFIKKYNLHSGRISDLIHGKIKSSKGWIILNENI